MASAVPVHAGSRSRIVILRPAGHTSIATASAAMPARRPALQTIMTLNGFARPCLLRGRFEGWLSRSIWCCSILVAYSSRCPVCAPCWS
jgi:hypothetical protein